MVRDTSNCFENQSSFDIVCQLKSLWGNTMRKVFKTALIIFLAYSLALIGFFIAMSQKPEVFSNIMSRTPNLVFMVFPFKPMWLSARSGTLKVGDQAPDFSLEQYDKKATTHLSALRGRKPVVLVFGSYT